MRRREVHLSSWSVDPDRGPVRNPPRPLSLRHENYEDEFDFTTVFYDIFWNSALDTVILLGPPLLNLETDLDLAVIAWPSMIRCELSLRHVFLGCQVIAKPPVGTTGLILRTRGSESFIAPQPNLSELFLDRRTAVTLSRNNDLAWIRDWALFNKNYHKCDALLLYDNGSDDYCFNQIYDSLEPVADGMRVVVLSWPFKYGVPDWRLPISYGLVDSLYCQTGMLEHARHRFLSHSRSVLNTDIDELVLSEGGAGIFELVEGSTTGLLVFGGVWVENHPVPRQGSARQPPRHRDFAWVRTGDRVGCETKWAVVPSRVPQAAQWHVHRILGMPASDCSQVVEMRHFRAINTDWTVDRNRSQERRTASGATDPQSLRLDLALQEALARIFPECSSGAPMGKGSRPARSAYAWRAPGGRLAAEARWREAVEAVERASSLMPEHPGFRLFLAGLQARDKNDGAARALRAEAEALRLRDPWYHLQCGRWLHDEGNPAAARRCFARAIELDPKFTFAYHEMARNQLHCDWGRPAKADEILRMCARRVPDDALTRALLAKELERKGRLYDACAHVEVAIALEPDNPHYHCLHARILRRIGRLDAAERAARRGIASDDLSARMQAFGQQSVVEAWREYRWRAPDAPELHAELAEILVSKGDLAEAEAAARRALACARIEPERHHRLSEILALRGRHDEAAAALEAAIALARQDMRRPTLRDWPLTQRNRSLEARALRLSRILSAAGRKDEAMRVLREALISVPDSSSLENNLAALLADSGASEAAATLLRLAIRDRPRDGRLRHGLSKVLEASDPPKAIASAKAAAELEPDNLSFQDHLVGLLLAAERTDEAALALAQALSLNPRHAGLYFELSRLLHRRERPKDALATARRAVELDPRRARWHDHLAELLVAAGRLDEAESVLRRALARKIEGAGLHFRLSRLLQGAQRLEEALLAARRAVALEPRKLHLREHLVALLIEAEEDAEADAALRHALELHPGDAALHFHHSRLLQRRRCPGDVAAARRAVELDPHRARWRDHLAALLMAAGRLDEAEVELRQALGRNVLSGGLCLRLSRLLQGAQRLGEALAIARRAIVLEPQKPYLREHLVALLLEAGKDAEAERALRQALELHPGNATLWFHQSRLLQRRRRAEEALAATRRAVELEPHRARWRNHLAVLLAEAGRVEEADTAGGRSAATSRLPDSSHSTRLRPERRSEMRTA